MYAENGNLLCMKKSSRVCFAVTRIFEPAIYDGSAAGEASAEDSITSLLVNRSHTIRLRSGAIIIHQRLEPTRFWKANACINRVKKSRNILYCFPFFPCFSEPFVLPKLLAPYGDAIFNELRQRKLHKRAGFQGTLRRKTRKLRAVGLIGASL